MSDRGAVTKLVMGESNACFDAVVDLGLRPASVAPAPSGEVCRERQLLLRAAIEFIQRQYGSGSPWVCYVAPAGAFDGLDSLVGKGRRRRSGVRLM
jgi:hypothetical protein